MPFLNLRLLVKLSLILLIVGVYLQVGTFDFVDYDDGLYVTENSHVRKGLTINGCLWAFTTTSQANWHPLTWLSHMLDSQLYGLNPAGHHYTNILFHIANTLILFSILLRMTGAPWKSAFVAALFAVHPLHVESVAWVSERKDVLSTFFGLLSIVAYDGYVKKSSAVYYLLMIFFLCLGLMAKPMLVTFPFVLLLLDFWPLKRIDFNPDYRPQSGRSTGHGCYGIYPLIVEKIPLFIVSVISCIVTFFVQKNGGAVVPFDMLPLKTRIANACVTYVRYVSKMFWPKKLAYFYPYSIDTLSAWHVFGAVVLIIIAIFGAIYLSRKYPYVAVGLFWYLGTLVPVIGLVQVSGQAMADRYTYIPLIGLFIVIAWGIPDILKRWRFHKIFLFASSVIILSGLTARAFIQTGHWKNSITLFENAVKVTENNVHALNNLATALADKKRYDEAYFYLSRAVQKNPKRKDLRMNFANVLFLKGKPDAAISQYQKILRTDAADADAHYNLACVLSSQNKVNEAVLHYKEALRIDPRYSKAHYNLGDILLHRGEIKKAESQFLKTIELKPNNAQAYNKLGLILIKKGAVKEAGVLFSKALRIDPRFYKARANLEFVRKRMSK